MTTRPWRIVDSGEMRAKEKLVNLVGGTRGQFVVAERLREADAEAIIKALEQLESGARGL